ncbi:MAG: galactoside ABC transporter permease [Bacilli bacterium]
MEQDNKAVVTTDKQDSPYVSNPAFEDYLKQLNELRADGENKAIALTNEIQDLKLNKQIEKEVRDDAIATDKAALEIAKEERSKKKDQVHEIIQKAIEESNTQFKPYFDELCVSEKAHIQEAKEEYASAIAGYKDKHQKRLAIINNMNAADKSAGTDIEKQKKIETKAENIAYKSHIHEATIDRDTKITSAKDAKYNAFMEKYGYATKVRNNKHSILESIEYKWQHYQNTFNVRDYLLRNALYFVVIALFIVFIIISKGNLLSGNNIIGILSQASPKLFYSLGVAGLILIAGTDLSIGRMTGLGLSICCLILSDNTYADKFGNTWFNLTSGPWGLRICLAIFLSILLCVLFSAIAGFFTAKFKMHPFITTLSTQLLMFGLVEVFFSNISSFNMNTTLKANIIGYQGWILIIYAAIATLIVWFIWNKTKFGKYMYAVGGNPEAAAVSGINVFKITMGIFVMAGVLYGLGGFFTAAQVGTGNPNTGYGTELDAIAACVIGGISFSGGVGTIKGAVIGTIIFTGMTYCLTNLGFDPNIQYIFKGAIIMAAVCLDSIKYLKKK